MSPLSTCTAAPERGELLQRSDAFHVDASRLRLSLISRYSTAYSLSGEIVLTLTSPTPAPSLGLLSTSAATSSLASGSTLRPTTIYLSSLLLTFEGKVEILSQNCGYAPFRLCAVEKELVGGGANEGKPISLTNRSQSNGTMRWSMTFDLAVPGWLPPSVGMEEHSGSSYTIHARAKFADDLETAWNAMSSSSSASASASATPPVSQPSTPAPSVAGLMSSYFNAVPSLPSSLYSFNPFSRSKIRSAQATPVTIKLNRFRSPKSLNPFRGAPEFTAPLLPPQIFHPTPSLFPVTLESLETRVHMPSNANDSPEEKAKRIPLDILSTIEVVAGVPEYVGTEEEKIPLSLRVRTSRRSESLDGLTLEAFDVEVEQLEKFRYVTIRGLSLFWRVPYSVLLRPTQFRSLREIYHSLARSSSFSATTRQTPPYLQPAREPLQPRSCHPA